MSPAPHPTDVEIARALNALTTTLNDARAPTAPRERLQAIVTGALGGEKRIVVVPASVDGAGAVLTDHDGRELGRVERREGRWTAARTGAPLSGGYVPSAG